MAVPRDISHIFCGTRVLFNTTISWSHAAPLSKQALMWRLIRNWSTPFRSTTKNLQAMFTNLPILMNSTISKWKKDEFSYIKMKERVNKLTYPTLQHCLTMLHITNANAIHKWWAIRQKIILIEYCYIKKHTIDKKLSHLCNILTFTVKNIFVGFYVIHAKPVSNKLHKKEYFGQNPVISEKNQIKIFCNYTHNSLCGV